jgi:hypothetical protein
LLQLIIEDKKVVIVDGFLKPRVAVDLALKLLYKGETV